MSRERLNGRSGFAAALLLQLAVAAALPLPAQEKKEGSQKEVDVQQTPSSKSDAPLPKIDLPEFVITGNEKIDLNISTKTEDDEDRIFTPEKPTPGIRSLEIDGAVSRKQIKQFAAVPKGLNGKIFGGLGFYFTPQFDGWFSHSDERSSYLVNGYYSSTEGHVNDAGWWRGGFGAKGRYVMPDSSGFLPYAQLSGDLRYGRESYHAYASSSPTQVRDLSAFDLTLGAGSRYALPYRSLSGFDYTGKIGIAGFSAADSTSAAETDLFLNGLATTRFLNVAFRGQIEYRATSYAMNIPGIQAGHWFVLKGDGQTLILPALQMSFALQQFLYRGNVGPAAGRFYPQLELRYFLTESATMYAGYAPTVERNTLSTLTKQNRYIHFSAPLVPSDVPVNVIAGLEFSPSEEITATAKYNYRHTGHYPTFLDTNGAKVWEVSYLSGVQSSRIDVSVLYRFNTRQNITAYVTGQSAKQKDSSAALPYIPAYSFGSVYHQFFDNGLHVEALAEYVAARKTNFAGSHENAGYVFTGVKADIELMERFRAYAEVNNLLNQHYYIWNGYRERTVYLSLGSVTAGNQVFSR